MLAFATKIESNIVIDASLKKILLNYCVCFSNNTTLSDVLIITYPCEINLNTDVIIIENLFKIFLAETFLLKGDIEIKCAEQDRNAYCKIANALYAIRCYDEELPIFSANLSFLNYSPISHICYKSNNILNLISGGKDSFASDYLLKKNNAMIHRVFIDGLNVSVSGKELAACNKLYDHFDKVEIIGFNIITEMLGNISKAFNQPPNKNSIPRGRDILTIALVYPLAIKWNCSYISHSCERDLWENNICINNIIVPFHDSQSRLVGEEMHNILKNFKIGLFSPISGMSEYNILTWLIKKNPHKAQYIQSCFWGNWCGLCSKCLRYYLIAKSIGEPSFFSFKCDPEHKIPDLLSRLNSENAELNIRYYKELRFLTGEKRYYAELMKTERPQNAPFFWRQSELL